MMSLSQASIEIRCQQNHTKVNHKLFLVLHFHFNNFNFRLIGFAYRQNLSPISDFQEDFQQTDSSENLFQNIGFQYR